MSSDTVYGDKSLVPTQRAVHVSIQWSTAIKETIVFSRRLCLVYDSLLFLDPDLCIDCFGNDTQILFKVLN